MIDKAYSHRELMEIAIEISASSIPEHSDRTDPLVGAVITTYDGKILGTAYRGELREGEHCEYTLIERKLKDHNLKGCVLYVTLEPCTDASRKQPKRGCSTHIVKSRISDVYIGALDPNPSIAGTGQSFLEERGVNVHRFPADLEMRVLFLNKEFFKEKEREAMMASAISTISEGEERTSEGYSVGRSMSDVSWELVDEFLERSGADFRCGDERFYKWASEFGVIINRNGEYLVTDLGLRLFGKNPEILFPNNVFKTEIKYKNGGTDIRDFEGSLIRQYLSLTDYVRLSLKKGMDKSSGIRVEEYEFPIEVIDEALANALIHRDYSISGMTNYLYMDESNIVIRSPGTVLKPLNVEDLNGFLAPSNSRNPKMMFVFNKMGVSEQRGIGLRKMMELPLKNFQRPVFRESAGCLEVVFDMNPLKEKRNLEYTELFEMIDRHGGSISKSELSEEKGIPPRTAERYLSEMVENNIIKKVGSGRSTRYSRV